MKSGCVIFHNTKPTVTFLEPPYTTTGVCYCFMFPMGIWVFKLRINRWVSILLKKTCTAHIGYHRRVPLIIVSMENKESLHNHFVWHESQLPSIHNALYVVVSYCSLWPVWVFHHFCTVFHERQNLENIIYIYIKFHENSSGCSRVLLCGQKDGQTHLTKLIVDFRRHSNCLCILSVSCNTDSCNTEMTHRNFYPQHPTAVSFSTQL